MPTTYIQQRQLVIIGGSIAGMNAAKMVKHADPAIDVLLVEKRAVISYNPCLLPYYIANVMEDASQLIECTAEQAKQEYGIDVYVSHEAMAIYPSQNMVSVLDRETGKEKSLTYDTLLLATGSTPLSPPVPGMNLPNIFQVRTLADGVRLKQYIAEHAPQKAVIIGGGYVGIEMAETCRVLGMDVTILEKLGNIMGTMGDDITEVIEQELRTHRIHVVKDIDVDAFEGVNEQYSYVIADHGKQRFEANLVIIAIGVRPGVALAKGAGIEIGQTGAIAVDQFLRTNIENIYAAGDCTEITHLVSGEKAYAPLATIAAKQGRVVGMNMVNRESCQFDGAIGMIALKVFDLEIARTGLSLMEAKRLGFQAISVTHTSYSREISYPGAKPITIALILDQATDRLLGAEMVGREGVAKRIDIISVALSNQMTLDEMTRLDLCYSPPFSPLWDPILTAIHEAIKKLR